MIFMSSNKQVPTHSITTDGEWASRHLHEESWIENYWKSRDHPHRHLLANMISKFSPKSVLEIGCASGPNLYHIAKKFPDAEIKGIDINPMAVQRGNEWLKQEGISNVKLEVGKAQELDQYSEKSFDVVFTDAVLIYIAPNEIKHVAKEMLRIGHTSILNEWHIFNKWFAFLLSQYYYLRTRNPLFKPESASLGFYVGHWARDYEVLFEQFVSKEKICITKLPKEVWNDKGWQRWGAIIEVIE
jgi:ubiquinone/menaquinone biosynthesis C-methylase UbiE